jgi:WD40 repeat protein
MKPKRYDAFISYSHAGSGQLARALQRGLQRLAKPFYMFRAMSVFRDETDLAAAPGLWSSIQEALDNSRFFILLASPGAAASKWVRKEVQHWLEKKEAEHLLIVLTDGSIVWRDGNAPDERSDFDWSRTTALPANLSGAFVQEPHLVDLCETTNPADLNPRNPLFMREVARLAAPIRGMPLAELVSADRREHRRTMRLVWAAVSLLVTLTILSLVLFFNAVRANREARSRLSDNYWAAAGRAHTEHDYLTAAHEFARAAALQPQPAEASHAAFNARARMRSRLVGIFEHGAALRGAAFSADGNRVLTWGSAGTARLWRTSDGEHLATMQHLDPGPLAWVDARFVDAGRRIVTLGGRVMRLWDGQNGSPVCDPIAAESIFGFADIIVNADESEMFSWGGAGLRRWSTRDGRALGPAMKHGARITGACFDAAERRILSWDSDGKLFIWDVARAEQLISAAKHEGGVVGARFVNGGEHVLSWDFAGTARLWNSADGADIVPPMRHEKKVVGARLSADGRTALTWSFDGTARLWNTKDGAALVPPMRHEGGSGVVEAMFNASQEHVVTWSDDGSTRVWRRENGELIRVHRWNGAIWGGDLGATDPDGSSSSVQSVLSWGGHFRRSGYVGLSRVGTGADNPILMPHTDVVRGTRTSADGTLALAWDVGGTVQLWHLVDGLPATTAMRHDDLVEGADFSPDEHHVITWSRDGSARLWRLEPSPVLRTGEHDREVTGVLCDRDGRHFVTLSFDHDARIWDRDLRPIGAPLRHDFDRSRGGVKGAALTRDESRLLTWAWDRTVRLWNTRDGSPLLPPMVHDRPVEHAAFCHEERLIMARDENAVRLWCTADGTLATPVMKHNDRLAMAVLDTAEARILSVGRDGIRLWDVATGLPAVRGVLHAPEPDGKNGARGAAFAAQDQRIVSWDLQSIRLWNAGDGALVMKPLRIDVAKDDRDERLPLDDVVVSEDGELVFARRGRLARVWSTRTGESVGPEIRHNDNVKGGAFDSSGSRVMTWADDVRIWNLAKGTLVGSPMRHESSVGRAEFTAGGRLILSTDGRYARLWSAADGSPVAAAMAHGADVMGASLSSDERLLLTWTRSGVVMLWNVRDGSPTGVMLRHPRSPYGVRARFHPDGARILTWFADRSARLWETSWHPLLPARHLPTQVSALTGTVIDDLGQVRVLSAAAWRSALNDYQTILQSR